MNILFENHFKSRSGQILILINVLTAIFYIVGVRISYQFVNLEFSDRIVPLWLPSALTLGLFFYFEYKILPGMLTGAIIGAISILKHYFLPLPFFSFLLLTTAFTFADTIQPILANVWLKKLLTQESHHNITLEEKNTIFAPRSVINPFTTVKTTLYFIQAVTLSPIFSAFIGTSTLRFTGILTQDKVILSFMTWWLANALANLVFSPVLILVRFEGFEKCNFFEHKKLELGILFSLLITINILIFVNNYPIAYLYLPLVLIAVCRFGGFIANILVALATLISLFLTAKGYGVFIHIFHSHPLIFLQSFMGILSLTALLFSALTQEREKAQNALKKLIESLETQVQCKTCQLQITQQKLQAANRELEKLVNIDALTQISNRRCFDFTLEREWHRSMREHQSLSLLMLDVDYFKAYNDFYGHPQGDVCLFQIAQILTQVVYRHADTVARYGGEEFVVLLPNTELTGAIAVAEKIQSLLAELKLPHEKSPVQPTVTLSIGINCLVPTSSCCSRILLQQADQALYTAKQQGRNQYQVFLINKCQG